MRASLVVAGDAAATARNVMAAPWLFKSAFACDAIVFLCDVAVAMLLYELLRPTSKVGSLIAAGFRLTGTAIYGVNLLNYFAAFLVLGGSISMQAFSTEQVNATALLFLDLHKHGYDLGLVFFGVHCLVLGHLVFRSASFSKVLGVLLGLAGIGYLVGSAARFLWPEYVDAVAPIYVLPLVGELAFSVWLVVKGLRMRRAVG